MKSRKLWALALLPLFLALAYNGCGQIMNFKGSGGSPAQSVQGTSGGNPLVEFALAPFKSSDVSYLTLCITRLKLTHSDDSSSEDVVINVGQIKDLPAGGTVTFVNVAPGTYKEVQLEVANTCNTGMSLSVGQQSSNSAIQTDNSTELVFLSATGGTNITDKLSLNIQKIVDALAPLTNGADIEPTLQAVQGEF